MQSREKLKISEILIKDRQRLDLGDIPGLAESIRVNGLIQPIVVNQDRRLIAGRRRLAAAGLLGWEIVDVVYKETLTEDQLQILELEEDVRRKDRSWQEKCLAIAKIHTIKRNQATLDHETWGQKETGEMLGITNAHVNYNIQMAKFLRAELDPATGKPKEGARFWPCENLKRAWDIVSQDEENERMALLAKFSQDSVNSPIDGTEFAFVPTETIDLTNQQYEDAKSKYYSNPLNPPDSFDSYWENKQKERASRENTIHLSKRLILGDGIKQMLSRPGVFDHVITDIPYGIDMSYLNQNHPRGGMINIETVEEEHDVEYNLKLIKDFFPAAYACTKDQAFVITWCDQMLWQFMYDEATKAGFKVQRWPITWVKPSGMNQCAHYNFTKSTEIAIVCRKPKTLLRTPQAVCTVHSSHTDELTTTLDHPFAKPFAVWEFLVDAVSIQGELICEPFAGQGSGVLSMLKMNRNVIAVESNEIHYNKLIENVKQHYLKMNPQFVFV